MESNTDKKAPLLNALSKVISTAIRPSMYLEKIPKNSSGMKIKVYQLLSQDLRIEAFDVIASVDSETDLAEYIDVVLYAARFLLANKLQNECYLFLTVSQSRIESTYRSPYDYTLYEEIGNMFYLTKNYQEAIKAYEKLLEIGERNQSALYFNIGTCYQEMSNYPQAIQAFLKSINLDPSFTKSAVSLGQCYQTLGQYDKAIGTFRQLPSSPEAFTCIGNAYYFMKNYEEAIASYLKALKLNPSPGIYNNLGAALKKAGLLQDAIFAFHDSLALETSADTAVNLITLLIEVGKTEDAEKIFNDSKKVLSNQDNKFFQKLIGEKQARLRRASVIMTKVVNAMSKTPSNSSPDQNVTPTTNKAVNLFLKKINK